MKKGVEPGQPGPLKLLSSCQTVSTLQLLFGNPSFLWLPVHSMNIPSSYVCPSIYGYSTSVCLFFLWLPSFLLYLPIP